jgi:tRNA pseudouridine55 synthase
MRWLLAGKRKVARARDRSSGPHGLLVVDKPTGPTSHDIVAQARRLFATRAVGHAGTLDPLASGVLLLLFGEATKLSSHLTGNAKRYRAALSFSTSTDTLDAEGATTHRQDLPPGWLERERLEAALDAERGRRLQVPPEYSAIKVEGKRAHRIRRSGGEVKLEPREVEVFELSLLSIGDNHCVVELTASKGYYVRAFARDVADHLGVPGHLAALRRLASGPFTEDEARTWPPADRPALVPVADVARRALPVAKLTPTGVQRARVGQQLAPEDFVAEPPRTVAAWFDDADELIALGQQRSDGRFGVVRGFATT